MIEIVIRCNVCDRVGDSSSGKRAHVLRRDLRALGWTNYGGIDLCPGCRENKVLIEARGLGRRREEP